MADIDEDKKVFRDKLNQIDKELEQLKQPDSNNILKEYKNEYNDNSRSLADILNTTSSEKQNEDDKNDLERIQNEIVKNQDDFENFDVEQAKHLLKNAIDNINKEDNIVEKKPEINDDIIKIKRKFKFRKLLTKVVSTNVLIGTNGQVSKTESSYDNAKEKLEDFKTLLKRQRLKFVENFKRKREEEQKEFEEKELEGMNRIKARRSFGHIDLIYLSILLMLLLFIIGIMLAQ